MSVRTFGNSMLASNTITISKTHRDLDKSPRSSFCQKGFFMIKPIVHDSQFLSQPSQPASPADLPIAQDLLDTLAAHQKDCVGMAANMIGQQKRIIAVNIGMTNLVMMNPQIISKSEPYQTSEGCLSLKEQRPTQRFKKITVQFFNLNWQRTTLPLTDWVAEIVQHEIDHCNGILI